MRVVIWENFFAKKTVDQNVGKFVIMYLLALLIPVQFCSYGAIAVFDVFVPIMGRAGTQVPPDIFIAGLSAFVVITLTSYVVSMLG